MGDDEYFENINFIKKSKINRLQFSLKNKIISYIPPADILEHIVFLSKKFLLATKKSPYIQAIKNFFNLSNDSCDSFGDPSFNFHLIRILKFFHKIKISYLKSEVSKVSILSYLMRRIFDSITYLIVDYPLEEERYLKVLKNLLVKNKSIETLYVRYGNKISNKSSQEKGITMMYLKEAFLANTSIKHLDLSDYSLERDGDNVFYLKEILIANKTLTKLSLRNFRDEENIFCIKQALVSNTSLTSLNLSGNRIGYAESLRWIYHIKEIFLMNSTLTELDLSNNYFGFGNDSTDSSRSFPTENLVYNYSLNNINLLPNNIAIEENFREINYLKEILIRNKTLTKLNLSNNQFGYDEGSIYFLAEGLVANTRLTSLNLSSNWLGKNPKAMSYINEILIKNNTLTELNLSNNHLGNDEGGIFLLTEGLVANTSLTLVNLSGNQFGKNAKAMMYLNEILTENATLIELNFSHNNFQDNDSSILLLTEGLVANSSLTNLNLSGNGFRKNAKAMTYLNEIIGEKKTLFIEF